MRTRRSVPMGVRSSLMQEPVQGRTQVAEGNNLKGAENREGGENSKALAGVGSSPSITMRGELHEGSRDSGASRFHMDYSGIPPSPPAQARVQGPDRADCGISKAAEVAVPAIDCAKSKQTQWPGDCVDDRNLLITQPKGKSSAEGMVNDSHDHDEFSKNLDLVGAGPAPTGSHSSYEHEHGSKSQMPGSKGSRGRSAPIPWIGLPCSRCKSTNFSMLTDAESDVNEMHYQCNNCKRMLCWESVRLYKHLQSELKVKGRAKKGTSQRTRSEIGRQGIIQAMSNLEPTTLSASMPNLKAMPPPINSSAKAVPLPSSTQKPTVYLTDSQATAFHSAKAILPSRGWNYSDKLEDGLPSRESNLQLVVAPEPEERFPMRTLEAKGPFLVSANLKEHPSNQSAKGNQEELSFANDGLSVRGLRASIRGHRRLLREENMEGSGGGTVSEGGRLSTGLPCPSCKSTNTRFCWIGRHFCDNCRQYWTTGHLQQPDVQLPSKQSVKGKGKEKEKETPSEDANQFSGKGLGPRSLPLRGSEDGDGGSNEGPLYASSCSRCKSTFTRLCTYGVFCDACGKHSPYVGTRECEANPPVAAVHEVFNADGRSRGYQLQSVPPRRRPVVDASTHTDPVAMVPLDSVFGQHIVHGLPHTHQVLGARPDS